MVIPLNNQLRSWSRNTIFSESPRFCMLIINRCILTPQRTGKPSHRMGTGCQKLGMSRSTEEMIEQHGQMVLSYALINPLTCYILLCLLNLVVHQSSSKQCLIIPRFQAMLEALWVILREDSPLNHSIDDPQFSQVPYFAENWNHQARRSVVPIFPMNFRKKLEFQSTFHPNYVFWFWRSYWFQLWFSHLNL